MKSNALKLAVASALTVGVAASAYAVEPWQVTGAETHTLRLGGATAQDQGIILLMRRLCAANTMARVQGTSGSAIMCQADGVNSAPIAAGATLVVYKNSASGSSSGVNPVAAGTTLPFLNLASLTEAQYTTAATCTLTSVASTADFVGYKNYACGANIANANVAPDGGISDVEPSLLGWTAAVGALDVFAGPQVIFGVPVSKNFRDALQTAQGLSVGAEDEANMPSLTKAQIASIFNGGILPLNRFSDINGNVLAAPSAGLGATVNICRRKAGSGTLASYNAYFLSVGCSQNVSAMVGGTDGDAVIPAVTGRVQEYGGTGQVIGCLNAHHDANKYAIGMASMENVPGSAYANTGRAGVFNTDTGNWRWIKIQGYAPTLLNTVQTKYDFVYEATWQHRSAGNPVGSLSTDKKNLFDRVVATNGSAAVIRQLNTQFAQSFGASGLLGKPGVPTAPSAAPAGALTAAEVVANPVNTWTRAPSGTPNSCQPPRIPGLETGLDMLL